MTDISTENDVEYIKAVFGGINARLVQSECYQAAMTPDVRDNLTDILAALTRRRLPSVLYVDGLLSFFRKIRTQQQDDTGIADIDQHIIRLREIRYFLIVLTECPAQEKEPPDIRGKYRALKGMLAFFFGGVLFFCGVTQLFALDDAGVLGVYFIAIVFFGLAAYIPTYYERELFICSLTGVTIFTVMAFSLFIKVGAFA